MLSAVPCVQCGATTPCAPKCDAFLSAQPTGLSLVEAGLELGRKINAAFKQRQADLFNEQTTVPLATWSPCKRYRYTLRRTWANPDASVRKLVTWILLNPSTADETQDDPTIRRCKEFSKSWGFDGLIIVNAYALRSTDPKGLWKVEDPNCLENDAAILAACRETNNVVCGWGANLRNDRRDALAKLLRAIDLWALKVNANGSPAHPLYQRSDLPLQPFHIRTT